MRLCPDCLKPLGERVYKPTKPNEPKQPLPNDHDMWLMCYRCYKVYPRYAVSTEDKLRQFTEPISNPHDITQSITGLDNKRYKKSNTQKQRERQKKELDSIEDPDERRDRKNIGFTEEIISDSLDY